MKINSQVNFWGEAQINFDAALTTRISFIGGCSADPSLYAVKRDLLTMPDD